MIDIIPIIFYEFGFLLLFAATCVVFSKSPVKAVLSLVLAFFASAVLWMIQGAEFLSLALIFVYVGAVMTLFLFVVMMLNVSVLPSRVKLLKVMPALFVVIAIFGFAFYKSFVVSGNMVQVVSPIPSLNPELMLGSVHNIASELYTNYLLAFEIVAILLLIAIIASIALTLRANNSTRLKQKIGDQTLTSPKNRIDLINMESE
jgi:NADH-quinone oxidoreductase subunit J|tara:strand:+ start:45 stop:653 length:609 start_codon:yes stop_codon:yes gene_type:complete